MGLNTAVNGAGQSFTDSVVVGVDVGGTTITALVADSALQERSQVTGNTDKTSARHTLESIITVIHQALETAHTPLAQVRAIGIGIPGKVNATTGVVQLAVNLNWDNMPAGPLLHHAFAVPCYLENDVQLAALGYYHFYTSRAVQHMAYVSVGTGVAAGLILDGRLYRGANGMAGEIGHMVLDPAGPRCNCGNRGCLETFTAGPAIAHAGQQALDNGRISSGAAHLTAVHVFNAARSGNDAAQEIIHTAGSYLGRGLQTLLMAYDIEKIVIGGGIARAGDIFRNSILREWQRQAHLSPLAADMLKPEKIELAPPHANAGAWGGVFLAHAGSTQDVPCQIKTI